LSFGNSYIDKRYDAWKLDSPEEYDCDKTCLQCGCNLQIDNPVDYEKISYCEDCHAEKVAAFIDEIEKEEEYEWLEIRKREGSYLSLVKMTKY
jgi:hypothetical protein